MADPSLAVHDAILTTLQAALAVPVHDHVPENESYPFVSLDRQTTNEDDTYTAQGDERFVFLTIWSDHEGQSEVLQILGQIREALHNAKLTLSTGVSISCRVPSTSTSVDADGKTYMGSATVRLLTAH